MNGWIEWRQAPNDGAHIEELWQENEAKPFRNKMMKEIVNNGKKTLVIRSLSVCVCVLWNGLQMNNAECEWNQSNQKTFALIMLCAIMWQCWSSWSIENEKAIEWDGPKCKWKRCCAFQLFIIYYKFYWLRNWFRFEGNHKTLISLNILFDDDNDDDDADNGNGDFNSTSSRSTMI